MSDEVFDWMRSEIGVEKYHSGREPTNADLAKRFMAIDPRQRAVLLTTLDKKLSEAHLGVEAAGKLHGFRRALISSHNAARRVNR